MKPYIQVIKRELKKIESDLAKADNRNEIFTEYYVYQYGIDILEDLIHEIYKIEKNERRKVRKTKE